MNRTPTATPSATPTDSLCDKALTSMKSYDVIYIIRMVD